MQAPSDHVERYTPALLRSWPEGTRHQVVHGTMVFCDISGFTALSERLAKKGRVGSEEVAAALTSVFGELLDIAMGRGGDLLKFGGDALLLLFTGPDHCLRAAAAAYEMTKRLDVVGKIETGSGRVVLGMTVGVNTGSFDMFVVGDRHLELIVAGPDASATVRAEESATRGEIAVTPTVAAELDPALVNRSDDGRLLLAGAPVAPPPDGSRDRPAPASPAGQGSAPRTDLLLPTALRPVVGTPASEGEHRRAVIAFVKFKGLDGAITTRGPDAVWTDLDTTVRIIQRAADDFGITFLASDIDVDGGKVILLAGAPATTDNDAERLLRAVRAIQESAPPLPLKIGVNAGTLFAGDVGSTRRAAYTVIGDAVNLAARLMAKAEPGQILAEHSVMARSHTVFETVAVEPFFVKGKSAAVEAVVVGPMQGTRQRDARDELPFLGRDEVVGALAADFGAVTETGSRLIDIVGPPGIGKTRLLAEVRAATDPAAWIKIDCERYEATTSYYALRVLLRWLLQLPADATPPEVGDALRSAAARAAPALEPWLPLVATAIGADVPSTPEVDTLADRFRHERTQDVVLQLVAALMPRPVGIVFDNAQWLDESSRALVMRAVVQGREFPGLICLSGRSDGASPDGAHRVDVEPLDAADALELARVVAARQPLPHQRLLDVVERSGGNPLFLVSLVEAAIAGEELPANVEDLINANIDALDQSARRVLRCAAVVGARFHPDLLAAGIVDEVADTTDPFLWARLGEYLDDAPGGEKVFRQTLFRDVAYAGLPYHRRRVVHGRIGTALEARGDDENLQLLSRHFLLAEEYERAWRYSVQAAERAAGKFAHVDAADLYEQALQSARRLRTIADSELAAVAEAMGVAAESAGLYEKADEAFSAARRRVAGSGSGRPDAVKVARLLRRQGLLRERTGRYPVALQWLSRGMRALDTAGVGGSEVTTEQAKLILARAGVRYRQGQYQQCVRACHEALGLDDLAAADEAHARYLLCLAFAHLGDPASEQEGRRALAIFDALGDQLGRANVLNNLGMNAYYRGAWDEAVELWSRSGDAREACGDIVGSATQTNNLGEIYSDQGKWEAARRCFTEALRIWEGARYEVGVALACSNLGRLDARTGQHRAAESFLDRAVAGFEAIGAAAFVLEAKVRRVENLLFEGDERADARARDLLGAAEAMAGAASLEAALHRIVGYAAWRSGDLDTARAAMRTSLDRANAAGSPYEAALTLDAMATVADDAASADRARDIFNRMGVIATPTIPRPT